MDVIGNANALGRLKGTRIILVGKSTRTKCGVIDSVNLDATREEVTINNCHARRNEDWNK